MTQRHIRPILSTDHARPPGALRIAGGWTWASHVEVLRRDAPAALMPVSDLTADERARLTAPRAPVAGLSLDAPRIMGILNTTPDSFSDGGVHFDPAVAHDSALAMAAQGADMLDIGGESTRPGSDPVDPDEERRRTVPLVSRLAGAGYPLPISIDTRKATIAAAALDAGAALVNDVAALGYDTALGPLVAARGVPVCLMHARGDPRTMQDDPRYDNVLLDVYDWLEARVAAAEAIGIARARILVDPGIGFGKTVAHNLALLRGIALFHGLGCPILLGASRKRFIGKIGGAPVAADRMPGSVAVALAAVAQGVQVLRVHDVEATAQALRLWRALDGSGAAEGETR